MTTASMANRRTVDWDDLDDNVNVEGLFAELRSAGFDLRRSLCVSYLLDTAADRHAAYAVRDDAARDGWSASLFGDRSGWVVWMLRVARLTPELVLADHAYVDNLARAHGGQVRGFSIEDPRCDDDWQSLAARITSAQAQPPTGATESPAPPTTRSAPIPHPRSA